MWHWRPPILPAGNLCSLRRTHPILQALQRKGSSRWCRLAHGDSNGFWSALFFLVAFLFEAPHKKTKEITLKARHAEHAWKARRAAPVSEHIPIRRNHAHFGLFSQKQTSDAPCIATGASKEEGKPLIAYILLISFIPLNVQRWVHSAISNHAIIYTWKTLLFYTWELCTTWYQTTSPDRLF